MPEQANLTVVVTGEEKRRKGRANCISRQEVSDNNIA
jgi:hypothetical protein